MAMASGSGGVGQVKSSQGRGEGGQEPALVTGVNLLLSATYTYVANIRFTS